MESHHYCTQVNEDFAQCVLFDGNTDTARLHGVEYIISAQLHATLPADERPYWHPHNYEILSGQLRAPGLPDGAEEAVKAKLNSYGKTWHLWKTGVHGQPADALPLGPPHLAWSFNHDGEMVPELGAARDARMQLDSGEARRRREPWAADARRWGLMCWRANFRPPRVHRRAYRISAIRARAARPSPRCGSDRRFAQAVS